MGRFGSTLKWTRTWLLCACAALACLSGCSTQKSEPSNNVDAGVNQDATDQDTTPNNSSDAAVDTSNDADAAQEPDTPEPSDVVEEPDTALTDVQDTPDLSEDPQDAQDDPQDVEDKPDIDQDIAEDDIVDIAEDDASDAEVEDVEDVADIEEDVVEQCESDGDCSDGLVCCDEQCVDLTNNRHHCAQCGNSCVIDCDDSQCLTIEQLSSGGYSNCVLLSNGTVRCWGSGSIPVPWEENIYEISDTHIPTQTNDINDAVSVEVGGASKCVIRSNGHVYCWGYAEDGLLGPPDPFFFSTFDPVEIQGLSHAISTTTNSNFGCAILEDYRVACWGLDNRGQSSIFPEPIDFEPRVFESIANVSKIVMSHFSIAWLTHSGQLFISGQNPGYPNRQYETLLELDIPGFIIDVTMDTPGNTPGTICALNNEGELYCWGLNRDGQAGQPTCQVCDNFVCWTCAEPGLVATNATKIYSGGAFSIFYTENNEAYQFGRDSPDFFDNEHPIREPMLIEDEQLPTNSLQIGYTHICVHNDTNVWCRGSNLYGESGGDPINSIFRYWNQVQWHED